MSQEAKCSYTPDHYDDESSWTDCRAHFFLCFHLPVGTEDQKEIFTQIETGNAAYAEYRYERQVDKFMDASFQAKPRNPDDAITCFLMFWCKIRFHMYARRVASA